jgi:ATP-dependent Clp protease ATP-binding subunit ClpA
MVLTGFVDWSIVVHMFERFTDRARHVVVSAQEEARGLQHNYIGTEHLLLGLLGEPRGVAALALDRFGITLDGVRDEVKGIIGIGKGQMSGHIPFTPRAKKTLELALREALQLNHSYIGTEHILLGLIREGDGVAVQIMKRRADLLAIRMTVLDLAPAGTGQARGRHWLRRLVTARFGEPGGPGEEGGPGQPGETIELHTTPAADTSLNEAARLAGPNPVGSHHLLLAALADPDTAAARALASLGVDLGQARDALRSADVTGTSDEPPEEAGRRQMLIRVSEDKLTIEAADRAIVRLGRAALDALGDKADPPGTIRGDLPASASLCDVWQALRDSLQDIHRRAAQPADSPDLAKPEPTEPGTDVA